MTPEVEAIVPTFFVGDVRASIAWYERVMGFSTLFVVGDPPDDAGVALGPARIHLAGYTRTPGALVVKGACYLRLTRGVDEYVARIEAAGQPLAAALKDHAYGMREATVRDPDGNDIYVGQPIP